MTKDSNQPQFDQRRIVHTPKSSFMNRSLLERLIPALGELIPGSMMGHTPAEYESVLRTNSKEDTLRHNCFVEFLKTIVGEEPFERFQGEYYRISYLIHPLYISVAVSGSTGEEGDTFTTTSVFNFPLPMLQRQQED